MLCTLIPPSRSPRHAHPPPISCRGSLQTGNYALSPGFSADQIAAFPSTRSRALNTTTHRESLKYQAILCFPLMIAVYSFGYE